MVVVGVPKVEIHVSFTWPREGDNISTYWLTPMQAGLPTCPAWLFLSLWNRGKTRGRDIKASCFLVTLKKFLTLKCHYSLVVWRKTFEIFIQSSNPGFTSMSAGLSWNYNTNRNNIDENPFLYTRLILCFHHTGSLWLRFNFYIE